MEKILIVDDSPISLAVLAHALEGRFEYDLAINGAEAVERLGKSAYACILLDIAMPIMDGFDVLAFMRQCKEVDPAAEMPPVIVVTGIERDDLRERCLVAGAAEFLRKPFKSKEIRDIVARVANTRIRVAG